MPVSKASTSGLVADVRAAGDLHRAEVEGEEPRVAVAGDEREPPRRVDRAMRALATRERDAPDDLVRARVDDRDVAAGLDVDEDAAASRRRTGRCRPRRRARSSRSGARRVRARSRRRRSRRRRRRAARPGRRQARRDSARRGARETRPSSASIVNSLVRVGRRGKDAAELRHGDHAVNAGRRDRLDDLARAHVEGEQLARVHVRDPEPVRGRIEARVVEANARPRQRDPRDLLQRQCRASDRECRGSGQGGERRAHAPESTPALSTQTRRH